jgi:hypothetical protein
MIFRARRSDEASGPASWVWGTEQTECPADFAKAYDYLMLARIRIADQFDPPMMRTPKEISCQ